jgi:hypothetical protein
MSADDGPTLNFTNEVKLISEKDFTKLTRKVKPQRNDISIRALVPVWARRDW